MFVIWFLSIALYWSGFSEIGIAILALAAISCMFTDRLKISKAVLLSVSMLILSCLYGVLINSAVMEIGPALLSAFHMVVLVLVLAVIRPALNEKQFKVFIRVFVFSAFAGFVMAMIGVLDQFVFYTARGQFRYEFIFVEPSYLAIYASLLLVVSMTWLRGRKSKVDMAVNILLVFIVFVTGSGSGIAMTLLFIFLYSIRVMRISFNRRQKYVLIAGLMSALILGPYIVFNTSSGVFMYERVERLLAGGYDPSVYFRFYAPLQAALGVLKNYPIFGAGFGFGETYMDVNYTLFDFMSKKDYLGNLVVNLNIDNAYVAMVINGGIAGIAVMVYVIHISIRKAVGGARVFILLSSFSLIFSGALIHPLFVGLVFVRNPSKFV